jgi:hypothetical protein
VQHSDRENCQYSDESNVKAGVTALSGVYAQAGCSDRWKINSVRYVGPDYLGRPLIHINYHSGFADDRLDAVRE